MYQTLLVSWMILIFVFPQMYEQKEWIDGTLIESGEPVLILNQLKLLTFITISKFMYMCIFLFYVQFVNVLVKIFRFLIFFNAGGIESL